MYPILISEVIKMQENHKNLRNELKYLNFEDLGDDLRVFGNQNSVMLGKND